MENVKELYVLEKPIETKIGYIYPVLVDDYYEFLKFNGVLNFDKNALISYFKDLTGQNEEFQPFLDLVEELDLFDFIVICGVDEYKGSFLYDLYDGYKKLFEFCFKDDVFHLIENNNDFDEYINIIRDINGVKYEPASSNPEIERRNQMKRRLDAMKGENITFEDMFISVCVGLQKLPSEVNKMTIFNFYKIFAGIGQFKNYDTSTLFATVSSEVKIEPWYKSTEVKKEQAYITEDQLEKARQQKGLKTNL